MRGSLESYVDWFVLAGIIPAHAGLTSLWQLVAHRA